MTRRLHHEQIFRGKPTMQKLAEARVHICGAGALGSNLAESLGRCGVQHLVVIDHDRIEEHNIGTQVYSLEDVGGRKAEVLQNILYRELELDVKAHAQELTDKNIEKLLKDARIVVDAFDNSASRKLVAEYCKSNGIECLHVGVNDDYGEIVWNARYVVPSDAGLDVCDYPLARNLILLVTAVATETLVRFLDTGTRESYSITIGDLSINRELER